MKLKDVITESVNVPIIVVDVQPAYCGEVDGPHRLGMVDELAVFLSKHKANVLMMVNAEDQGLTEDTIPEIQYWWQDIFLENQVSSDCMNSWEWLDKGYGYLRGWMGYVEEDVIIKAIREMYAQRIYDSRDLFDGDLEQIEQFFGDDWNPNMHDDAISVEWISITKLREFSKGYICGGAKDKCLREVQLIMNAFNIKYKEIDKFIYID